MRKNILPEIPEAPDKKPEKNKVFIGMKSSLFMESFLNSLFLRTLWQPYLKQTRMLLLIKQQVN